MIARFWFASKRAGMEAPEFATAWRDALSGLAEAPGAVRPERLAMCTTLSDVGGPPPRHDGVSIERYADVDALGRFDQWLGGEGHAHLGRVESFLSSFVDAGRSPVVIVEPVAVRGQAWLEQRMSSDDVHYKHMALAQRTDGLTAAEFSARWRGESGRVQLGSQPPVAIPAVALGLAYVQNHPIARPTGDWAYDAINEVYFDDVDSMKARIDWFADNVGDGAAVDIVRRSWFLAVREEVVISR